MERLSVVHVGLAQEVGGGGGGGRLKRVGGSSLLLHLSSGSFPVLSFEHLLKVRPNPKLEQQKGDVSFVCLPAGDGQGQSRHPFVVGL